SITSARSITAENTVGQQLTHRQCPLDHISSPVAVGRCLRSKTAVVDDRREDGADRVGQGVEIVTALEVQQPPTGRNQREDGAGEIGEVTGAEREAGQRIGSVTVEPGRYEK